MSEISMRDRYRALLESGELHRRVRAARAMLSNCRVCPHICEVDRTAGEIGICCTGDGLKIGAAVPHFGEEPLLVGAHGTGNIFLSACNLKCAYCQNYELSRQRRGREVTGDDFADAMLRLQAAGCRFVGWVSPSHLVPQLLDGFTRAAERGFERPLIHNSSGYDGVESLRLLDGIVSLYLPDLKYASDEVARRLSGCGDYVAAARAAIEEMYRQVGDLRVDEDGLALGGVLVRHLVLPDDLAGSWDPTIWPEAGIRYRICASSSAGTSGSP